MMTVRSCEYHVFELFVFEHIFGKQQSLLSLSIHGLLTSDSWFCFSRRRRFGTIEQFCATNVCRFPKIKTETSKTASLLLSVSKL